MKDLTQGPISRHLLEMAAPMAIGMLFQTMYFLVDLYFVGRLGDAAIAGVGAAGTVTFLVMAATQVLAVGSVALISQAVGRKDQPDANRLFNQTLVMSAACAVGCLLAGYAGAASYARAMTADAAAGAASLEYLRWYLPTLALQFVVAALSSALRGTGIVKPAIATQMFTVVLNVLLAPVLIGGWGTGHPLGVAGAGLASSIAVGVGTLLLVGYFARLEHYVQLVPRDWAPRLAEWRRICVVGLPAGGEFLILFMISAVIYWAIRPFGAHSQAGFGVGMRVMQAIFLPAMAVGFSVAPIVGQNFGAGHPERVREAFRVGALIGAAAMLVAMVLCLWNPAALIAPFAPEPSATAVGAQYLRYVAWNFLATGFVLTCSGFLQGLGKTLPSLWSSGSRVFTFTLPVLWLSHRPGFRLTDIWITSITSVTLQALLSAWLVRRQMRISLAATPAAAPAGAATAAR